MFICSWLAKLQDRGLVLAFPGAKTLDTCKVGAACFFLEDIFSSANNLRVFA